MKPFRPESPSFDNLLKTIVFSRAYPLQFEAKPVVQQPFLEACFVSCFGNFFLPCGQGHFHEQVWVYGGDLVQGIF